MNSDKSRLDATQVSDSKEKTINPTTPEGRVPRRSRRVARRRHRGTRKSSSTPVKPVSPSKKETKMDSLPLSGQDAVPDKDGYIEYIGEDGKPKRKKRFTNDGKPHKHEYKLSRKLPERQKELTESIVVKGKQGRPKKGTKRVAKYGTTPSGQQRVTVPDKKPGDPRTVAMPPEVTQEERNMQEEQNVARCEILMLKGIRSRSQLMALLGMPGPKVARLMRKVHARWEITAGGMDLSRYKGEATRKLELLESELWVMFTNTEDPREKLAATKMILDVTDKVLPLRGITETYLKEQQTTSSPKFNERMGRSQALQEMAQKFMSAMNEAKNPLEHEDDAS